MTFNHPKKEQCVKPRIREPTWMIKPESTNISIKNFQLYFTNDQNKAKMHILYQKPKSLTPNNRTLAGGDSGQGKMLQQSQELVAL